MNNAKALQAAPRARSAGTEVLDRVIGIARSPLLPGEEEADYVGVAQRVVAVVQPKDAIEEFLTRDVIDLTWDILRLRRLKARLLRVSAGSGVTNALNRLGYDEREGYGSASTLGSMWASGDESTREEVAAALKTAQLSTDDVMAEALDSRIETFERIDRMLSSAEARRNNALRELDRHRASVGAAARQAIEDVEDVKFRDVETGEEGGGSPT